MDRKFYRHTFLEPKIIEIGFIRLNNLALDYRAYPFYAENLSGNGILISSLYQIPYKDKDKCTATIIVNNKPLKARLVRSYLQNKKYFYAFEFDIEEKDITRLVSYINSLQLSKVK